MWLQEHPTLGRILGLPPVGSVMAWSLSGTPVPLGSPCQLWPCHEQLWKELSSPRARQEQLQPLLSSSGPSHRGQEPSAAPLSFGAALPPQLLPAPLIRTTTASPGPQSNPGFLSLLWKTSPAAPEVSKGFSSPPGWVACWFWRLCSPGSLPGVYLEREIIPSISGITDDDLI